MTAPRSGNCESDNYINYGAGCKDFDLEANRRILRRINGDTILRRFARWILSLLVVD